MNRPLPRRTAATLMEVMLATTLSATLMASSMVVLRSSHAAWLAHEADSESASNLTGALRHVVRVFRQATAVTGITPSPSTSGSLAIQRTDGSEVVWTHSADTVWVKIDSGPTEPLAEGVEELTFEGYEADGVTASSTPADIKAVRIVVKTTLPSGGSRTVSSYAWVRSW